MDEARQIDIARAQETRMWIIRSDVAGRADGLVSYGSTGIVDRDGIVVQAVMRLEPELLIGEIDAGSTPYAAER